MRYLVAAILCLMIGVKSIAQINYGGSPSFLVDLDAISQSREIIPAIDLTQLAQADAVTDQIKEAPWRFGVENDVEYNTSTHGYWTAEGDENIWRIALKGEGATSMSVRFSEFGLEKGAYLFVWAFDSHEFIGKFDHRSRKDWGGLATGIVNSSEIIVEYHQPSEWSFNAPITIDQVVYGYRSLLLHPGSLASSQRGPFGNSGACNINVNCPEGALWATEKRSVALIVQGGFAACTGALINNTLNDGTPYFLTANHCVGNPGAWLYYFNHESATCDGNTGPTNQSVSGGTLLVSNGASDYALLELSETPPASFNVQYAGWDASGDTPLNATGIHHPSGDVKKISFEEDSPYFASVGGAAVWMIDQWEHGVTEPGSSGAPLFDHNHRIIGQLYGGSAACAGNVNNGQLDYYGRLNESYTLGAAEYLDPTGSGIMAWDGFPDGAVSYANDAGIYIEGAPDGLPCGAASISLDMVLMNTGTETLTSATLIYNVNGTSAPQVNWTGNLTQYESETISTPTFDAIGGENTITAEVSNPNGQEDENLLNNNSEIDFMAFTGETLNFVLSITLDDYGSETTWEINKLGAVIYSGGPYNDGTEGEIIQVDLCLEEGCYIFNIEDSYGDGICCEYGLGHWEILNNEGVIIAYSNGEFGDSETQDFCIYPPVSGCTDPTASNYDSEATEDDGSCIIICVASDCCISGTQWDLNTMTCVYEDACSADIAKDGFVAVDDLLELLSAFGSSCEEVSLGIGGEECLGAECCGENTIWCETLEICIPFISCPADLNDDESIGSFDLLVFLPYYGGDCEDYESLPDCEVTDTPWMCGDLVSHQGYGYSTVLIGEQCWFSENCRYLPSVSLQNEGSEITPYYYVYGYSGNDLEIAKNTTSYQTYGTLYNRSAITQDICPNGWHVPSHSEFLALSSYLGDEVAGDAMKSESPFWNGNNSSGFSGLPGGKRGWENVFDNQGSVCYFWTSSGSLFNELDGSYSFLGNSSFPIYYGLSARCIKD